MKRGQLLEFLSAIVCIGLAKGKDLVDVQHALFEKLFLTKSSSSLITFPLCFQGDRANFSSYANYLAALKNINQSALDVAVEISLAEISEINEREQSITIKLYRWLQWSDCRLMWKLEDYALEQFSLRLEAANTLTFYTPLISLLREITPHYSHLADTEIKVHHSGTVTIYKEYVSEIGCTIDIHAYPFDTHICDITFEAAENKRIVNITFNTMGYDDDPMATQQISHIHTAAMLKSDAWDVVAPKSYLSERVISDCQRNITDPDMCTFRQITHKVIIRRYPMYQLLNLVVPTAVTMILSGCVFLTAQNADKMNLSITVLFVLTMYVQIMYSKMPETGETALISQYYLFCIALESFSCLAAILSGMILHSVTPVPAYVTRVVDLLGPHLIPNYYKYHARCRHRNVQPTVKENGTLMNCYTEANIEVESNRHRIEWHLVDALFDRSYFYFHCSLSIASLTLFLSWGFTTWSNFGYLLSEDDWKYVIDE